MNNSLYQEILNSTPQDLFPDVYTGEDYEIYLDPEQVSKLISTLYKSEEYSVASHIMKFLPKTTHKISSAYD